MRKAAISTDAVPSVELNRPSVPTQIIFTILENSYPLWASAPGMYGPTRQYAMATKAIITIGIPMDLLVDSSTAITRIVSITISSVVKL